MAKTRAKKLLLNVVDDRFEGNNQFSILNILTDGTSIYQNSYAKVFTRDEIGSFDISINQADSSASLNFFPIDGRINDYAYSFISYDTKQDVYTSGGFNFGTIVSVASTNILVSAGTSETLVAISSDYTSSKFLIEMSDESDEYYEYLEINSAIFDGEVFSNEYGRITLDFENYPTGIGTYEMEYDGVSSELRFTTPFSDRDVRLNVVQVSFASTQFTEGGFRQLRHAEVSSTLTSIGSTTDPEPIVVDTYTSEYNSCYFIAQVTDNTNNKVRFSEISVVNNDSEAYFVEYGIIGDDFGEFSILASSITELRYTPPENVDIDVVIFKNGCTIADYSTFPYGINFENSEITTGVSRFGYGNEENFRTNFDLKHQGIDIFVRKVNSESLDIVNLEDDTLYIPNHFYVTGEKISYSTEEFSNISENAIGIATTSVLGIGNTDKLYGDFFAYKVDETRIKLCTTPEESLSLNPNFVDFTSLGIGVTHFIKSKNQNEKCLILIDNVIQSPIISTGVTSILLNEVNLTGSTLHFSGISSFFGGDIIKVNDEIMEITAVGVGSTNFIEVRRNKLGTLSQIHTNGDLITKLLGNYNIIDNEIHFATAPYGPIRRPDEFSFSESSIPEYEIRSTFHGRVFLRSGVPLASTDTYSTNYLFDDISSSFDAKNKDFELTSSGNPVTGISTQNPILLINNVLQIPDNDYSVSESLGKSFLNFTGTATSAIYDPNNASVPRGGVIISAGSSNGFGFQPLVSAGGTAIVSSSGTIQSISIGNSGSGYRSGIQTNIRVGVETYSTGSGFIEFIGTATVSNGHVVSINITNPGSGYTDSNPPKVVIDSPIPYENLKLKYSNSSSIGVGTESVISLIVGQGSSVTSFELINYGYGYRDNEILTVDVGGDTGIPLDSTKPYEEFSLLINRTQYDAFSSWSLGEFEVLDDISSNFNGVKKTFTLTLNNEIYPIYKRPGSIIDLKSVIIVLINDIIQIPDVAYKFRGGSVLLFTEAPKEGDKCTVLFYKGTPDVDTNDVDIIEPIEIGDNVKVYSEESSLEESERTVSEIISLDILETNPYYSSGIAQDEELLRPLRLCKQRLDLTIDNISVTKDRIEYEPIINPVAKVITSVGVGTTQVWVDSVSTLFDYVNENVNQDYIGDVEIITDNSTVSGASCTAIVSSSGSIDSISITDGGYGYQNNPTISISLPYYLSSGERAEVSSSITSGILDTVSVTNPGLGYTNSSPPLVLVEPPVLKREELKKVTYTGDFGIISGISTTTVGSSPALEFELVIPSNSILRDSNYVESAITNSQLAPGNYFMIYGSTVGTGVTSLTRDDSIIGIGTTGIDNVYQVDSVSFASTDAYGIGPTTVKKVTVKVVSTDGLSGGLASSSFYGNFTWGLIKLYAPTINSFEINNDYGVVGLNSTPTVKRINRLKYASYNLT